MYKTVVFDLDGTLLNTLDDLADAGNRLCADRGWPTHTAEEFRYFVGNGIPKLIERLAPPEHRTPAELAEALAWFQADYGAHLRDKTAPYPGIPAMLGRLKAAGVQLAVFSNKADPLAREVVASYFDPALFDLVRGQRPDTPVKPAPEGTRALLAALGADPAATLYVGTAMWTCRPPATPGWTAAACCGASVPGRNCSRRAPATWPPTPPRWSGWCWPGRRAANRTNKRKGKNAE